MNIEYHPKKVKLVPRMKQSTAPEIRTAPASPPPPSLWTTTPAPLIPQPKLATLEDLIRENMIAINISYNARNGRIVASALVDGQHDLSSDGATACEAVRKLATVVLDMAFEL